MNQRPFEMSLYNMEFATTMARKRVDSAIKLANKLEADVDLVPRQQAFKCKACYYFPVLGGAAMTTRPCGCCGIDVMYGSTNTDALCVSCAEKHRLCKHCGGDSEMRGRRKDWPKADTA
jgi:RNase P subunit RPR2